MSAPAINEAFGPELTLRFEPRAGDDADVGAVAFAESIILAVKALRQTAALLSNGQAVSIEYEVADLRHSSPATCVLKPRFAIRHRELVTQAQEMLVQSIGDISRGSVPDFLDYPTLNAYKELAKVAGKGGFVNNLSLEGESANVSTAIEERLDIELGKDRFMVGTVQGTVRKYSSATRNLIRVFPRAAPPVTCEFKSRLRAEVSLLVERDVIVEGRMRYRPNAYHPYYMHIRSIQLAERPAASPSLASLRGDNLGPSDGRAPEEMIREIRRAW